MIYFYLSAAIGFEVIGTTMLKASESFTRFWPTVITLVSYAAAFYLLALTMRTIPVGVIYAIWSGAGIVLIAVAGWIFYDQKLDAAALIGLGFIVAGVAIVNLFSRTMVH